MTEADFALLGIDAPTILYVWSWGFGSVVFSWFMGFPIGAAISTIKKL
ncbi:MAG: hypothetical protein ACAH12_09720 [Methylophilaceae bacterium]|nr:hypothetical protein [Methylovorus sp. MM2]